ncbi:MAG: hypothetical protein K8F54_04555 [Altibacter sp.]|uniref:hypothetical protein n=1 Tax=Altibacter sp. TaxID=2024823 RepID=UPI001DE01BA9|nr:hypothetical protein [Altibacter sp.]MBZ0326851.1 hypothetical protein [Altibacter sp.]
MNEGGFAEYVNGSNGHTCGDYINDTPAAPGLYIGPYGFNVDEDCNYDPQYFPVNPPLDPLGMEYNPDTYNYMSFSNFSCMGNFTYGQSKLMKGAILFLPHFSTIKLTDFNYKSLDRLFSG